MQRTINGGIYWVVNPSWGLEILLPKIEQAIKGSLDVLQIWNHWQQGQNKHQVIDAICQLAHRHGLPVIIHEEWQLLLQTTADGVHFDHPPVNLPHIRSIVDRPFYCGITCGNDLSRVHWANANRLTYISFCSMFPSASAGSCEIVSIATVKQARQITSLPIFAAGGITIGNMDQLRNAGINGIAVVSAIMKADDTQNATQAFKNQLNINTYDTSTGQ